MKADFEEKFKKINEILEKTSRVLIASHENPDADAVGSALALRQVLKKKKISSFVYLPDSPPGNFNFLPGFFEIKNILPEKKDFGTVFFLDYGDFRRLRMPDDFRREKKGRTLITLDHHIGDQVGEIKVIDTKSSSTAEIIYWWLKDFSPLNEIIDRDIAECLLTGIVMDTGGFSHVSTGSKTFQASSGLLSKGASLSKIVNRVFSSSSIGETGYIQVMGKILGRIKIVPGSSLVYSWISKEDLKTDPRLLSKLNGISSIISKESTCHYALFLVEYEDGKIKGSLRSEPFKFTGEKQKRVDKIAQKLGGGGHPYAAGFKQEGSIKEVLRRVIKLVQ
jgi:bifunctional oligoribonuclease and PAP phosphatase NrnA